MDLSLDFLICSSAAFEGGCFIDGFWFLLINFDCCFQFIFLLTADAFAVFLHSSIGSAYFDYFLRAHFVQQKGIYMCS